MSLSSRWQEHLNRLKTEGRFRALQPPQGIDFCSNDYLSLGRTPRDDQALARGGLASRLLRGHHGVWEEVETLLARWHGAEAALVFSSGYLANEGLLSTIIEPGDLVFSDAANHRSIIDGLRLTKARRGIYRHNDLSQLGGLLQEPRSTEGNQVFVVTESLFSMEGDRAPLEALVRLTQDAGAHLIVDEAHATGCFGPTGGGLVDAAGVRHAVLATMHTGGKALAVPGAYVCGSRLLKEYLINRCRHLIFTTALPAQVGAWWLASVECVQRENGLRRRLHGNARLLRAALAEGGIDFSGEDYIIPVLLGADHRAVQAAKALQAEGFDVRAIRPPTVPEGTARLRISVHADHEETQLMALARCLAKVLA